MENKEKKVITFIMEDSSNEVIIGSVMREYFLNEQIRLVVAHGDIVARDYVSVDSIIRKISDLVSTLKGKYRYETSDFIKIIHLANADGASISDECVWPADVDSITYYEGHIETRSGEVILDRNHKKSGILFKLYKTGKIGATLHNIYYNSCNLEYVLLDELEDFINEGEEEMSDEFADRCGQNPEDFIVLLLEQQAVIPGTYQDT